MINGDNWRLITIVSIAGFIGLLFDQMLLLMFIATFAYALWLHRSWQQLHQWLQRPKKVAPPSAEGMIDDVCREVEQIRRQNRSRKKKLSGYLKHFKATTAALPYGIVVLEEDGRILWVNTLAERLLELKLPRDTHVRINNVIRDLQFQRSFLAPIKVWQDIVITSPSNASLQLELKLVPYLDSGRLLIARDISSTLKLQTMRRDFVGNVSHELRTPLTVLHGYLEVMGQDSPSEQWAEALPVMREQTQKMNVMITELLALSQLETGEKEVIHLPTEMAILLSSIKQDAEQLAHYQQHHIQLEISSDLQLLADEKELRSALSNLVFNAVKYTPAKSHIKVSWDGKSLTVSDNGDGIEAHHLDRLTERFYRVDSGRSQEMGGTGLGLAIVKHVLQRHYATLEISSEVGVGTHFICHFPASQIVS